MPDEFDQVGKIVLYAVGLINGSLGLALRRSGYAGEIVGVGRRAETLETAVALGSIDRYALEDDPQDALDDADLIVSGTLPHLIADSLVNLSRRAPESALLTDVGSVKAAIVRDCEARLEAARFVGGHPIAGSHETGSKAARADLFDGRLCVLTPTEATDARATETVRRMWERARMRVIELEPNAHDRLLAASSHLPHVVASVLASVVASSKEDERRAVDFAGGGFRDTTRIAQGSAEMWESILRMNAEPVELLLRQCADQLIAVADALKANDGGAVRRALVEARDTRLQLEAKGEGE